MKKQLYNKRGKMRHFKRERKRSAERIKALEGDELQIELFKHFIKFNEDLRRGE